MGSFVSVIIPVFRQEPRLHQCLQALERQTYPTDQYEVIVVNNNPSQALEIRNSAIRLRIVEEAAVGSYAARNKGIELARGDVFAFTDEDCVPEKEWLERGVARLREHPDAGLVGGGIVFDFRDGAPRNTVEWVEHLFEFDQEFYVKNMHFSATANVLTTRAVMEKVGRFNAALKSGGDVDWGERVFAAGYTLYFADDVRIHHPAIASYRQFFKKVRRVAGGDVDRARLKGRSSMGILFEGSYQDLTDVPKFLAVVAGSPKPPHWLRKLQIMLMIVPWLAVRMSARIHLCLGGSSPRA